MIFFGFVCDVFWICPWYFLDLSVIFFGFVRDTFWICLWYFLDLSVIFFWFVRDIFWICPWYFLDLSVIYFGFVPDIFWFSQQLLCISQYNFLISWPFFLHLCCLPFQWPHRCVGHPAWAPEGREGRSQAGPKGHQLEVEARRAPKLQVCTYLAFLKLCMFVYPCFGEIYIFDPGVPGVQSMGPVTFLKIYWCDSGWWTQY